MGIFHIFLTLTDTDRQTDRDMTGLRINNMDLTFGALDVEIKG